MAEAAEAVSTGLQSILSSSEEAQKYFIFSEEIVEATESKPTHKVISRLVCAQHRFTMQRTSSS